MGAEGPGGCLRFGEGGGGSIFFSGAEIPAKFRFITQVSCNPQRVKKLRLGKPIFCV